LRISGPMILTMKVKVIMMIIEVSTVIVDDINMLVNCSLMTQFESNCILLTNKYSRTPLLHF
jgi:hypothetical protein